MKMMHAAVLLAALTLLNTAAIPAATSSKALLYASSSNNGLCGVSVFDESQPAQGAIRTLEGLTACSLGMAVDSHGNVYVSQQDPNEPVLIFKPGASKPSLILTNTETGSAPLATPTDVAVASDGTVYVLLSPGDSVRNNLGVLVYAPRKTTPSKFLQYNTSQGSAICRPSGIAVDAKKDIYMSCNTMADPNAAPAGGFEMTGSVIEFPAGGTTSVEVAVSDVAAEWGPKTELGTCGTANDIQIDSKGNLLVLAGACYTYGSATTSLTSNAVFVYAPGDVARPSQVIPVATESAAGSVGAVLRLDSTEKSFFVGDNNGIQEYTYPGGKLVATFDKNGLKEAAFAVSPSAPLAP